MGSLLDVQFPTEQVTIPGQKVTLTVRGLALVDVAELLRRHGEALEHVYSDQIVGQDIPSPAIVAKAIMVSAPLAVAEIIAMANDNPDMVEAARKLSPTVQIEALAKIAVLTFHSEAEVKKLAEIVLQGSDVLTKMVRSLTG